MGYEKAPITHHSLQFYPKIQPKIRPASVLNTATNPT